MKKEDFQFMIDSKKEFEFVYNGRQRIYKFWQTRRRKKLLFLQRLNEQCKN